MRLKSLLGIVLAVLLVGSICLGAEVKFQTLNLEQALQRAGEQKKLVFVDFFTTWCMPCKMMDASTWKDEKVGVWLARNTVAIRLDAEKELQVTRKYKVSAFPSLLFIKPDGQVLDRIVGARDAESFLREAAAICSGEDPYARARRILRESGENDLMARMKYAYQLVLLGKPDEALAAYLWCYDRVMQDGPSFVNASQVIAALGNLAMTLPTAREALRLRLDKALARLEKEAWTVDGVADVLDMSRFAGSELPERLAIYDKLKAQTGDGKGIELATLFMDELLEARRYAELAGVLEPEKSAEGCLQEIERQQEWRKGNSDSQLFGVSQGISREMIGNICKHYETLLGSGEEAKASSLAEKLLLLDGSAGTLNGLARSGLLTGRPGRVHLELAEKAWGMSEKTDAGILGTFCRLLARFDQLPRAEALIREFQKGSGNEKANRELERCLDEIRRGLPPPRAFGNDY